jgi:hypothetical protein
LKELLHEEQKEHLVEEVMVVVVGRQVEQNIFLLQHYFLFWVV